MRCAILSFALGVIILQQLPALPPAGGLAVATVGIAGLSLLLPSTHSARRIGSLMMALLAGLTWAAWRADIRLAEALDPSLEGRDLEITGWVASLPVRTDLGSRFEFVLDPASTAAGRIPSRIQLSWAAARDGSVAPHWQAVAPGERWQLTVRLRRPHGNANPGGFDYEVWLLSRQLRAVGYVRPGPVNRLAVASWHPGYWIEQLRGAIRDRFDRLLPPDTYRWQGVLLALAIGKRLLDWSGGW